MEPVEYLRSIRRRWPVIVLTVILAVSAGWFATRPKPGPTFTVWTAPAIMINTPSDDPFQASDITNPNTVAALVTIPNVASRVAVAINYQGDPTNLAGQVVASADSTTGLITITATSGTALRATALANGFADAVVAYLRDRAAGIVKHNAAAIQSQINHLESQLAAVDRRLGRGDTQSGAVKLQRRSLIDKIGRLTGQYQTTKSTPPDPGVEIIQRALATPSVQGGFPAPKSRWLRIALASLIGLLAGIVIAFTLERFDTRMRTRQEIEKHYQMPVLAEIPFMRRRRRRKSAGSPLATTPLGADAFRLLRTGLITHAATLSKLRSNGDAASNGDGLGDDAALNGHSRATVIMVTSAGAGEGKSTVVANLAAVFGEAGQEVLVLSCDFRRPKVHEFLGGRVEPGLTDAIESTDSPPLLAGRVQPTSLSHVQLVASGRPTPAPAELLTSSRMGVAVEEAKERADVVIVDTPPLLAGGDAAPLLPRVDKVLLVAKSGRIDPDLADWTQNLLERLEAPTVGVALNAVRGSGLRASSLGSYGYSAEPKRRKGFPRLARHRSGV